MSKEQPSSFLNDQPIGVIAILFGFFSLVIALMGGFVYDHLDNLRKIITLSLFIITIAIGIVARIKEKTPLGFVGVAIGGLDIVLYHIMRFFDITALVMIGFVIFMLILGIVLKMIFN